MFVSDLATEPTSRLIVSAIIELAHSLDMHVIAEGVESAEQHVLLASLGCDAYQGYYFARPMSLTDLKTRLRPVP